MAALSSIIRSLVLFLCAGIVQHVAEVILTLLVESVLLHQVVLVGELKNDGEEPQQRKNHILVESPLKDLDLGQVCLDQIRMVILAFKVGCKLGDCNLVVRMRSGQNFQYIN